MLLGYFFLLHVLKAVMCLYLIKILKVNKKKTLLKIKLLIRLFHMTRMFVKVKMTPSKMRPRMEVEPLHYVYTSTCIHYRSIKNFLKFKTYSPSHINNHFMTINILTYYYEALWGRSVFFASEV